MSASGEAGSSLKRLPLVVNDPKGRCVAIACGNISGHVFLSKLDELKKAQSKCVFVGGMVHPVQGGGHGWQKRQGNGGSHSFI